MNLNNGSLENLENQLNNPDIQNMVNNIMTQFSNAGTTNDLSGNNFNIDFQFF